MNQEVINLCYGWLIYRSPDVLKFISCFEFAIHNMRIIFSVIIISLNQEVRFLYSVNKNLEPMFTYILIYIYTNEITDKVILLHSSLIFAGCRK